MLYREYEYIPKFEFNNFNGLIIDAGAHVGLFSLVCSVFANKVVAVEPHPINYNLLKINLTKNRINNVIAINKALWTEGEHNIKLYEVSHSGGHSTFQVSNKYYQVSTITLNEIVEKFGDIELLKLDVEGSEFKIFVELHKDILSCINSIVAEIHLWAGSVYPILQILNNYGFNTQVFTPPLLKKGGSYSITLHRLLKLKLLRNLLYNLASLIGYREKNLHIIFATQDLR